MTKAKKDLVWSVLLCATSIGTYFYSNSFKSLFATQLLAESSVYTKIWAVVLFLLSVALGIRSLKNTDKEKSTQLVSIGTIASILALIIYLLVLNYVGFLFSTVIFLTGMITYYQWLSLKKEERVVFKLSVSLLKSFILSAIVSIVLQLIFTHLFGVLLPTCIVIGI